MSIHPEDHRRDRERKARTTEPARNTGGFCEHFPHRNRVQELLEANNRYLERARIAEAKLATLESDNAAFDCSMPLMPSPFRSPVIQRFGRVLRGGNAESVVDEHLGVFNEIPAKFKAAGIHNDGVHILALVDQAVAMVEDLSAQRDKDTPALMNAERELAFIRSRLGAVGYCDADTSTIDLAHAALLEIGETRKVLLATGHDCKGASLDRLVDKAIDVERTRKEAALSEERAHSQKRHNRLEGHLQNILKAVNDEFDKADIIPF